MSVLTSFSIFPVDKGESVSSYVSRSIEIIEKCGLPFKVGPMGTSIEGEWDEVMNVITQCFEEIKKDSNRVYISLTADFREGKNNRITGKIESLERKLGHPISS